MNKSLIKSTRALHLIILIKEHTKIDANGKLAMFWIPSAYTQYIKIPGNPNLISLYVSGGGDAAILRSLEKNGLIYRPNTTLLMKYIYAISEKGLLELEKYLNKIQSNLPHI